MLNYSKNEVVLLRYPFSDVATSKVRPAVIVHAPHASQDCIVVPLSSRTTSLLAGEFVLQDWQLAGLHVATSVKRGFYTVRQNLILKLLGHLTQADAVKVERAIRYWLGL